jgi:hypothetical protein
MGIGTILKLGAGAIVVLFGIITFFGGFYSIPGGTTAVIQNTLTGSIDIARGPKFGLKMPFFSNVETFIDVSTVTFGESTDQNTRNLNPVKVSFADTYKADIPISFRFRLPTDDKAMVKLFTDYRRADNMVDNLFVKNAVNVTTVTATQFTGEEFFQGGQNAYKERLEDQMKLGIYQTERRQVEIEGIGLAPVSVDNNQGGTLQTEKQLVWKTVPVVDKNNNPIRQSNPFQAYGIEVTQIAFTSTPVPEEQLDKLLTDKKILVAQRIRTIQEQETAKAEADTEQLKKEIERTKAVQDANRQKELAVIAESQKVEVAKQQAAQETVIAEKQKSLAVIDKQKELEVASANLDIQRANAASAIEQAKATRETGLAEAAVLDAKYKALGANKEIYLAEVQRDVNLSMYSNLANFKVQMPTNMVTTAAGAGGSGLSTNLDIISAFSALGAMDLLKGANDNAPGSIVEQKAAAQ